MASHPHFLIAESESLRSREERRASSGRSSGEAFRDVLNALVPDAVCDLGRPAETGEPSRDLAGYDAVFLSGSPVHVYHQNPAVSRLLAFMRAVFASGTPSFGSCAGLQVAVAAAGGAVRENRRGHEVAFARRIVPTAAGGPHPLLDGRPAVYDALTIHADEVVALPPAGATLLATNRVTPVQAVEIRFGEGVFWGVQYHPELPLSDIAGALRRQARDVVEEGLCATPADVEDYAAAIEALDRDPSRRDLAWRLGVDEQVTDPRLRQTELRNFIGHLVNPTRSRRHRA